MLELDILKDVTNKLKQIQAAKKMKVSRTTFWRVLSSAGKKVTDALINGKAIRIKGGQYALKKS